MSKKATNKPNAAQEAVVNTEVAEADMQSFTDFEDISSISSTEKRKRTVKKVAAVAGNSVKGYSKVGVSHMDKIIKAIAILLSLTTFLIFVGAALIVVYLDKSFTAIAVAIGVVGVIISFIVLFLIYGLGQIISQNNEILRRL